MSIYNANIPQPSDLQSVSQPSLLNNFGAIQNAFDKNHVTLSDTVNRGLHKFMEMPVQSGAQTTASGEGELHTQTVSGTSQLFYSRDNSAGTLVQLTTAIVPLLATSGYSFIPGNMIVQWGQTSFSGSTGTVSFPIAFPTSALVVLISPFNSTAGSSSAYVQTWGATTFTVQNAASGTNAFTFLAIGS